MAAAPSPRSVSGGWWTWLGRYGPLAGALVLFSGSLVLSFDKIREQHQTDLVDTGMSLWLAMQADFELQRLRHALDAYALGHPDVDRDQVLERWDIFWSRLPLLIEGADSATVRAASDVLTFVPQIIDRLSAVEPLLQTFEPGNRQRHVELAGVLASFAQPMHDLVVDVESSIGQASQRRYAADRQLYLVQAGYLVGILASGGILIALLFRETARVRELLAEATAAERRVAYLAHHDPVTQLPNRWLFEDRLEHALRIAQRDGGPVALHYLDLDHFKTINDSYGHVVGDRLLVAVAGRLRTVLRDSDTLARLGGDEFAVIQTGIASPASAKLLGQRLVSALRAPLEVECLVLQASVSVGIGLYPDHASTAGDLHRAADRALYRAKAAGRDGCYLYDPRHFAPLDTRDRVLAE